MGHIYRDLPEIPVPSDAKVNMKSKQVSKYYQLNGRRRRIVIGVYTEDGKMHVNDNFRVHYSELCKHPIGWFADKKSEKNGAADAAPFCDQPSRPLRAR